MNADKSSDLISYEGRERVNAALAPAVCIIGAEAAASQTLLDCVDSGDCRTASAYVIAGQERLDPNSAELATLAVWAGNDRVQLPDGSIACSPRGLKKSGASVHPKSPAESGWIIHRHLVNAGLLTWRSWTQHPARSIGRLIPLRIKEDLNRFTGRKLFDLSFYLQFQPRSVMVGMADADPVDYRPRLGSKARVALITPHLGPGGAETVLHQIAGSLERREYEISVIATHSRDDRWRKRWEQVSDYIYDLGSVVPPDRIAGAVYSMARNWKYDFILIQNSLPAYSAAGRIREALPSSCIMDLIHSIDDDWDIAAATAAVSGAFTRRIAISETAAQHLRRAGTSSDRVRLIRNGIDLQRFRSSAEPRQSGPYRILFAARLDPVKRPLLVPEIAAELLKIRPGRDFRFVIAGDGPEGPALRRRVDGAKLSPYFEFMGHVPDIGPVIRNSDLLLLTSRNEGVPLIVLEAMASGKPVVCSKSGAIPEAVIDGKTGFLVDSGAGEVQRLALGIHQLLESPELRQQMGEEGCRSIEAWFNPGHAQQAYRELFRKRDGQPVPMESQAPVYRVNKSPSIAIDGSPLLVRSAGVKTWLFHWTRALAAAAPGRIHLYLAPLAEKLNHGGGPRQYFFRLLGLSILNGTGGLLSDYASPDCDVFHVSNLLRYPPRRLKLSSTVHDLTAWTVPECHTPAGVEADREFARRILMRADGLMAVSENTRADAVRILGIAPEKIRVIYPGVAETYFRATRAEVNGEKPYFLYVGTIEPRKNVDSLLTAWSALPGDYRRAHRLLIAGMKGWKAEATMKRLAQMGRDDRNIRYLGYVPEDDMPALVVGAHALVYPALYEGFGIPVAQAMAAGCPVITSNTSSLPEVTAGAAVLVDPRSTCELMQAMREICDSRDLRDSLRQKGLDRAKNFTWDRAAVESLNYFRELFF
jgi:glycosyltransferase involved in cell wall biosynthesis